MEKKIIHEAHSLHIDANSFKLLCVLKTFEGKDGIFPFEETIASRMNMSRRNIDKLKKKLKKDKLLDWEPFYRNGKVSCKYNVDSYLYDPPPGWNDKNQYKYYGMFAQLCLDFSPKHWRFLCLVNTQHGWPPVVSLNKKEKAWKITKRDILKMEDELDVWLGLDKVDPSLIWAKDKDKPHVNMKYN